MDATRIVENAAALGAATVLEQLGLTSGEISQRKARTIYGKWFDESVNRGRLYPCRVEDGRTGTRWFRVADILALKTREAVQATFHQNFFKAQ